MSNRRNHGWSYTAPARRMGGNRGGETVFSLWPQIPCRLPREPKVEKSKKVRKQGNRKLTPDQVREVRKAWAINKMCAKHFYDVWAAQFGCSSCVIKGIIEGLNYKEVV